MDDKVKSEINRYDVHRNLVDKATFELVQMAERLCPGGEWVFQIFTHVEYVRDVKEPRRSWMAVYTNGDDNVTALGKNIGAAVALLVHYALDGALIPLGSGNGGRKIFPADNGWTKLLQGER